MATKQAQQAPAPSTKGVWQNTKQTVNAALDTTSEVMTALSVNAESVTALSLVGKMNALEAFADATAELEQKLNGVDLKAKLEWAKSL